MTIIVCLIVLVNLNYKHMYLHGNRIPYYARYMYEGVEVGSPFSLITYLYLFSL